MIVAIRISGKVKINKEVEETLFRLGLRRKYACILIHQKDETRLGMLKKVRSYVSYGEIEKGMLTRLIEKRGRRKDKEEIKNPEKIAEELEKGKSLDELELKSFFRLHPARGGIKNTKLTFPRGILGNNKEINKLVGRML